MKKYLIFLISLFSILLIDIKSVKAYNEEVSPMLDLSILDITFDNVDENDPRYSNLIAARNFVKENNISNYLITPYYYNDNCKNTGCTKNPAAFSSFERLLNGSSPSLVLDLENAISLIVFDNNVNLINVDIAKSNYNYYFEYTNSKSYTYKMIYFYDNGNSMYGDLDYTFSDDYLRTRIYSTVSNKKFILPYVESDLKGAFFTSNYVGNPMSRITYYKSVKYNDLIYNEGDLFINFNNNGFASTTGFDYEITEGSEKGKKLILNFNNYLETDYVIITNYQSGEEERFDNLKLNNQIIYDNISQDNTYQIKIYDVDNNVILERNIDIQEQLLLTNKRYIYIANLNNDGLNSYKVGFFNTKDDDKCFYHLKDEEEVEIDCLSKVGVVKSPNKNTYAENYIKDKNGNIVVRKNVNLNYLKNYPQFKFESYYDSNENKQTLKVIVDNLQDNDLIYYSYDNENWLLMETKRINYLDFYYSTNLYFKVERNSLIVSEAYFDLVYNSYENSSDNNSISNSNFSFKDLLDSFKQFTGNKNNTLNLGTNIYNRLKNSKLGLFLTILIVGSFIILIVKSIKR